MAEDPVASYLTPDTIAALESMTPPAPKQVRVVYVGPFAAGVEIAETGAWLRPGVPVEVPADLAGRAPSGTPGEDDYDPGEGLLAQVENFVSPRTKAAKQAKDRPVVEPVTETSEEQPNG